MVGGAAFFDVLCGIYDATAKPSTFERTTDFDLVNNGSNDCATVSADLTLACGQHWHGVAAPQSVFVGAWTCRGLDLLRGGRLLGKSADLVVR